jgi:hypothetical protein
MPVITHYDTTPVPITTTTFINERRPSWKPDLTALKCLAERTCEELLAVKLEEERQQHVNVITKVVEQQQSQQQQQQPKQEQESQGIKSSIDLLLWASQQLEVSVW